MQMQQLTAQFALQNLPNPPSMQTPFQKNWVLANRDSVPTRFRGRNHAKILRGGIHNQALTAGLLFPPKSLASPEASSLLPPPTADTSHSAALHTSQNVPASVHR